MPPSNLFCLLLAAAAAGLLAPAGRVHAQGGLFPTPASTNLSTSWTINLNADGHGTQQSFSYMDGMSVSVFLLQSVHGGDLSFAACFYCTTPCTDFYFGVCILQIDSGGFLSWPNAGTLQVIWSANRGRAVRENATLAFTASGDLLLRNIDGSLVWSTNTSDQSVAGMTLTKSGNLVLFDRKNAPVWQTFSHPTDCLLPGQQLVEGMRLTPNASATNWTTNNQLYVTVRADGLYAFVESSPPQLYYQKTVPKAGSSKTYMTLTNDSVAIFASSSSGNVSTLETDNTINMTAGGMRYIRLESDGHLKLYQYEGMKGWPMAQDILEGQVDDCAYPTVCGEYGICINGQCTCPIDSKVSNSTYFKQTDDRRINLGCTPLTPISCASMQDHQLLALSNVSYFNYVDSRAALPQMIDEESCKKACLRNCSCKAAFFQYGGNDSSQGSCYLPTQVFSMQVNQWELTHYSSSAYLKVQITRPPPSPSPSNSNGTVNGSTPTRKTRIGAGTIVGIIAGVISLLTATIITLVVLWRRYRHRDDEEEFGEVPGMTTRFTFEQLKGATEQFSKLLGKGGFGSVFEGQIGEQRVAVKQLDRAGQGKKEFLAEVETIGNIHHLNLVKLIGFCAEKSHRLLVYEYMPKGSLDNWIYFRDANRPLDWHTRCRIIADIAKGLAYLHEECMQRIAHLDIKPQNILLDDNFSAKLSDFGLSKMIDRDKSQVITRMRGTPGYLAPEWLTSQITEKVDIYSFGVVVMEIVSGRKNLDYSQPHESVHLISILQEKARNDQLEDLIDMNGDEMQIHKEEVIQMMKLAMWCLQIDYRKRPQMSVVVKVLEGTVNVETNIEFNFVALAPGNLGNDGKLASSAPLLASHLSGPR
ncbi:G-type lectin S-receptor-like serine/threonine-protein kinase SD2-5 [Dichanthelium oligosanthes]|uniref:Receptor-like serine/threonine-protein kinase n=1 Tax=Dichanthelium oligosanthes TaxID=888268 RepID=A0A1E5VKB6_9POAL|nr:G-type lectin S-receptor-like serine/threonine-protein kinase SD2-5 [Dichanthelium oligosanthes]